MLRLTLCGLAVPLVPITAEWGLCTSRHMTSPMTRHTCFSFCHLQAMEAAFLRMKEKYLSVSVCPVKKSHWEIVRSIVMFGKGEWAVFLIVTLGAE